MSQRTPLIAGNWKMYKTISEAVKTAQELAQLTQDVKDREIMIAPPFTALDRVFQTIQDTNIQLGAQNLFWELEGAYTGEISPKMLKDTGCRYVIIGHSERRQFFGETDETVNKKIRSAIINGLVPIFCVGETEKEREDTQTFSVLDKQMKIGLYNFSFDDLQNLVIAYEPVWAIGTGKTASPEQAQEVHAFLRKWIADRWGAQEANKIRILYGGSVKPNNINELMAMNDIDGALVGGASLNAKTFSEIIHYK